jgi:hypothetical protein
MRIKIVQLIIDKIRLKKYLAKRRTRAFLKDPYIIVMVDGGLASQINKYLIGQFIEKSLQTKVKYDISWFKKYRKCVDGVNPRNFDLLNLFPNINFPIASNEEIKCYKDNNFYYKNKYVFTYNESLLKLKAPCYLDGYIFNWQYYKNITLNIDDNYISNKVDGSKLKLINNTDNSVAIHIRRGDFINAACGVLNEKYFLNAINYIDNKFKNKNLKFFIFSNDVKWVEGKLATKIPHNIDYHIMPQDSEANAISDFYLISKCKHQICSNSGFSYFAAYFNKNKNKLIIVPNKWILNNYKDNKNMNLQDDAKSLNPDYIKIPIE